MFGRNRHQGRNPSGQREGRGRRGSSRESYRNDETREAFGEFLHAIGNIARGQAFYFADRYRNKAADVVDDFATSLRETGTGRDGRLTFVGDIADDLEDLSDVIRDLRLSSVLREAEHLVRRRPVVFSVGAIAAGYLIARAAMKKGREASEPSPNDGRSRGGRF